MKRWYQLKPITRVIISWVVVATVALGAGIGIGASITKTNLANAEATLEPEPEPTAAVHHYNGEVTDPGFTPVDVPLDEDLQEYIFYLSDSYGLDHTLVLAVIQTESDFDPKAVSPDGEDWGLMQINEVNHAWLEEELGVKDFLDPYQNVQAGTYMLAKLFEKYDHTEQVLMAYNMGETGARRAWENGACWTNYVDKVLWNQYELIK